MIQTIVVFSGTTDYLHTSGKRILDADGRVGWIAAVNRFVYETSQKVFHGFWIGDLKGLLDQVANEFGLNAHFNHSYPMKTQAVYGPV
ncbi:MAG: hypothetical protein JW881_10705 [Spirochaetales bacterium]|nr:hypothetical protein [Spirochaetales bacterium]